MSFKENLGTRIKQTLRLGELDEFGQPREAKRADRTYRVALILSVILYIYLLSLCVVLLKIGVGKDDFHVMAMKATPSWVLALVVISLIAGFIQDFALSLALISNNPKTVYRWFWFSVPILLLYLVIFVFLQMRGNGVAVIPSQGDISLDKLTNDTQKAIVQFALDDPENWLKFQDDLDFCCGLNIGATYADQIFGIENFVLADLVSGQQCDVNGGLARINNIHINFPEFTPDAQEAADSDVVLGAENYFCEERIIARLRSMAQRSSIAFGVLILFLFIIIVCVGRLLYSFTVEEGGYSTESDKIDIRPVVESTVFLKAGFKQTSGQARLNF